MLLVISANNEYMYRLRNFLTDVDEIWVSESAQIYRVILILVHICSRIALMLLYMNPTSKCVYFLVRKYFFRRQYIVRYFGPFKEPVQDQSTV